MRNKGQVSTLGLVIGLVVLIVVALALIMVVTGRIGGVGTSVGEQEEGVFDNIRTRIGQIGSWGSDEGTTTTTTTGTYKATCPAIAKSTLDALGGCSKVDCTDSQLKDLCDKCC